jgi:hypothetical protein
LFSLVLVLGSQLDPGTVAQRLLDGQLAVRVSSAEQLVSEAEAKPEILQDAAMQDRIIAGLELENDFIRRNLERPRGQPPLFPEEYGEHYSRLLGLADRLRREVLTDAQGARLLRAIVLGTYNGESEFSVGLAEEGEKISPFVLQAVKSSNGPTKWNGLDLIGLLSARDREKGLGVLSNQTREAFRLAAREGLQDPKPEVRRHAVNAVVRSNDRGAIPLLRYMAEKDTDAKGKWSVRAVAAEGVRSLERSR